MFTGLVASRGKVTAFERSGAEGRLQVETELVRELAEGDSIAVNGVCLTALEPTSDSFSADLSVETLQRSTLARLEPGSEVNLELAMRASDRLGGHIVQGHVDGVATLARAFDNGGGRDLTFALDRELLRYVVEKGSITIDGVSLTVTEVDEAGFSVALIPETLAQTTLAGLETGDRANLELDVIAKYVQKLARPYGEE